MKSILCDDNGFLSHRDLFKNISIMSDIIRFYNFRFPDNQYTNLFMDKRKSAKN